ncbi:MAG: hypothetical protein IIA73_08065 [Proteobacteria bacterium]|nr:hypothetical protein [Pseudomonadota bacterium]
MSDILKGLTGGGWIFLSAWIFPSAIALGAFWLIVFPDVKDLPFLAEIGALTVAQQGLVVAFSAMACGFTLSAASTPLYRLLEGYTWPKYLRDLGVERQRERKQSLNSTEPGVGWEEGLRLEKLRRFPVDENEIAPTRLGNALRAFETYGKDRFCLDSQTLWTELYAVVPESLQLELDRSRALVDFFVALVYLSAGYSVVALLAAWHVGGFDIKLIASGVGALALTIVWYHLAISSSSYWHVTVQALVNIGRKELAGSLGLKLPKTFDEERKMWGLVTQFVFYPYHSSVSAQLDDYRHVSVIVDTPVEKAASLEDGAAG